MKSYGETSRAVLRYKHSTGNHIIGITNQGGHIYMYDPQTGKYKSPSLFDRVDYDSLRIVRIDNLELTEKALDCVRVKL